MMTLPDPKLRQRVGVWLGPRVLTSFTTRYTAAAKLRCRRRHDEESSRRRDGVRAIDGQHVMQRLTGLTLS